MNIETVDIKQENETQEETEAQLSSMLLLQKIKQENETQEETEARMAANAAKETLERKRNLAAERQRRWRNRQTPEESKARLDHCAQSQRIRRANETQKETEVRLSSIARAQRIKRANETQDETRVRLSSIAQSQKIRRANKTEEETEGRLSSNAQAQRIKRANETQEETRARLSSHAQSQRNKRAHETREETQTRLSSNARSQRIRRANETKEETQVRLAANVARRHKRLHRQSQEIRHQAVNFDEAQVIQHSCGPLNVNCQFCGSINFATERSFDGKFTSCCQKGKIKLKQQRPYPDFLREMMSVPEHPDYRHFRDNIRSYNSAVSFTSMGAKIVDVRDGVPYIFKVHGQIYHRTSRPQTQNDQYAQLYVIDNTQATDVRMEQRANSQCYQRILDKIDGCMRRDNRLIDNYHIMREVEARAIEETNIIGKNLPILNMVFHNDHQSDVSQNNIPNANEIAMVFENNGDLPFKRDIRIYPKIPVNSQHQFINISIQSPNLEPMAYPLLCPYGEHGWQNNWQFEAYTGAQTNPRQMAITKLQYIAAQTAIRGEFNPKISAGKLTQQWITDSYLQIEANSLNDIRQNHKKLQMDLTRGLTDQSENATQNSGRPNPLSTGNMIEHRSDAMAIFAKHGAPDLFITFTANPKWPEIIDNLQPGEQVTDRPDLVVRVFKLKLKCLMKDLTVNCVLGKSIAYVYSIEFQKHDLPHAHILITLQAEDKFVSTERIDQIVCAEIPTVNENPRLQEIITRCMLHGSCGIDFPHAPCKEDGKCKKMFPKAFQDRTVHKVDGYPLYRRRPAATAEVKGKTLDNRHVVPYNPYLISVYNAHMNVEVCTSLHVVKYIYEYTFKGFEFTNMILRNDQIQQDEPFNYINARYVSSIEAMWHLLESPIYDCSHTIIKLPVHLLKQQEPESLKEDLSGETKLTSWFKLNLNDETARKLLYADIPCHYVYVQNQWQPRRKGGNKVVGKLYIVGTEEEERFYLRTILLHCPVATSFQFLRTVNNVTYDTFKETAFHLGLLSTDAESDCCLQESAIFQIPNQMRELFAYICCFCMPTNTLELWNKYFHDMSLDYRSSHNEDAAVNWVLHDLNTILKQHGLSCSLIGLPAPRGNYNDDQLYNQFEEEQEAKTKIDSLIYEQLGAFQKIIYAVDNINVENTLFCLDGPSGSGKTYLYSTLLSFIRGKGEIALPFTTTDIAATLLKGAITVHIGFKLPVPLLDTSVSSMKINSSEAEALRIASLIIIDEITMLTKHELYCIDQLLRDIMQIDLPFGQKVIVIGTRGDVNECGIKSSKLWQHFSQLTLTRNMRSDNQTDHNHWLFNAESDNMSKIQGAPLKSIVIPQELLTNENLIDVIYGENLKEMTSEELAKRVILAPTIEEMLEINQTIIENLSGDLKIYYSADSIISGDPTDTVNYPVEFLNAQVPSGVPPHKLALKIGVMIMLLHNINPKKGLCNGTRLIIRSLQENFITAEIVSECNHGDIVFIPRIDLAPSDINLPFTFKRRQFPIIPAYSLTIDKSQGLKFDHVGVYIYSVFSHEQLYLALSRCKNPQNLKVYIY